MNTTTSAPPHAPERPQRLRIAGAAAALALGLVAFAGCGSSSSSGSNSTASTPAAPSTTNATTAPSSGGSSSVSESANPSGQLEYTSKTLTAKAGQVSIAFTNMSPLSHNMTIESSSGQTVGATPTFQGATKTLSLNLKPGTYKFFCTVPGHRQAGMEGTLVVK